jgi:hypothetical protein
MFVSCQCYVLSDRGLCDGMITRPEDSYRLWRVVVCNLEKARDLGDLGPLEHSCAKNKTNSRLYGNLM